MLFMLALPHAGHLATYDAARRSELPPKVPDLGVTMPQPKSKGLPNSVMEQCQRIAKEGNEKYLKESDARLQYDEPLPIANGRLMCLAHRAIEKDAKKITQEVEKRARTKK